MEKEYSGGQSNYDLRVAYLQALKQFTNAKKGASTGQANKEIDAYLGYEKQLSSQLQSLLNQGSSH
jgi:hypothetical protein